MTLLPTDRYQRMLMVLSWLFLVATCIHPPHLEFMLMQHTATVLALVLLTLVANRISITRLSFTLTVVFIALHTLGTRYLYSYTPYDAWTEALLGVNLTETFGFERNHYDRFVHFCYGLLMVIPILEFERKYLKLSIGVAALLAIECILATSAAYELAEWGVALVFAPEWAESFLGMQGDAFDAQKDMGLALLGAILSACIYILAKRNST